MLAKILELISEAEFRQIVGNEARLVVLVFSRMVLLTTI